MNNSFLLLILVLVTAGAQAQTKLIAHKSHSGSALHFRGSDFGNFGNYEPPVILKEVKKINDTTAVTTSNILGQELVDTLYHHPLFSDPAMTKDSLTKLYNNEVEFKDFDKKKTKTKQPVRTNAQPQPAPSKIPAAEQKKRTAPTGEQKKKGLILLVIGGGTFLGTGLLMRAARKRKSVPEHA
jgi:hypothetical protein